MTVEGASIIRDMQGKCTSCREIDALWEGVLHIDCVVNTSDYADNLVCLTRE